MSDADLLEMLAAETERRSGPVIEGIRAVATAEHPDPKAVEGLRIEVHGMKGAAAVVGQPRIAELGARIEEILVDRSDGGRIEPPLAERLVDGVLAMDESARAAAAGKPEPPVLATALERLAPGAAP